jgi:hypothetical protein
MTESTHKRHLAVLACAWWVVKSSDYTPDSPSRTEYPAVCGPRPRGMRFDQLHRREFITLIGGAAVAWPLAARAQQADRVRRIGVLLPTAADDPVFQAWIGAFLQGLALSDWTIGRNVRIDTRWAGPAETKVLKAEGVNGPPCRCRIFCGVPGCMSTNVEAAGMTTLAPSPVLVYRTESARDDRLKAVNLALL